MSEINGGQPGVIEPQPAEEKATSPDNRAAQRAILEKVIAECDRRGFLSNLAIPQLAKLGLRDPEYNRAYFKRSLLELVNNLNKASKTKSPNRALAGVWLNHGEHNSRRIIEISFGGGLPPEDEFGQMLLRELDLINAQERIESVGNEKGILQGEYAYERLGMETEQKGVRDRVNALTAAGYYDRLSSDAKYAEDALAPLGDRIRQLMPKLSEYLAGATDEQLLKDARARLQTHLDELSEK